MLAGPRRGRWIGIRCRQAFDGVFGEIAHRTENVLHVDMAGITQFVEVQPDAEIIIPDIPGDNNVNQLRHHLEIQRMSKSKGNVVNPGRTGRRIRR